MVISSSVRCLLWSNLEVEKEQERVGGEFSNRIQFFLCHFV